MTRKIKKRKPIMADARSSLMAILRKKKIQLQGKRDCRKSSRICLNSKPPFFYAMHFVVFLLNMSQIKGGVGAC